MNIKFADDTQISALAPEIKIIIRDLFAMDDDSCFLSDESTLYDFFPNGVILSQGKSLNSLYEEWEIGLQKKLENLYGLPDVSIHTTLVFLAANFKNPKLIH